MTKFMSLSMGILFALLLPRYGYTQNEGGRGTSFWGGIMLGGGFVEFVGGGIESPQTSGEGKPGIIVGGHLGYDLHRWIAVHAEMLFAMKGSHHLGDGNRLYSYTLNYLELPLLARVSLPLFKNRISPFVAAGPAVSILLDAKAEDVRQGQTVDLDGVYTSTDFGVVFGTGATVRLTPYDLLGLEARYDMGLRAIVRDRETINNRGILLVLRYETCICSRSAAR